MTAAAAALAASTTRARRWPRLVAGLMLLALVAGGATTGAVVAGQHSSLDRATADFAGAHSGLDRALARARADGVAADRLAAIVSAERSVLAEPGHANLLVFDSGQIGHRQDQAARLQALSQRVPMIEREALTQAKVVAYASLDGLQRAIDTGLASGVDIGPWLDLEMSTRTALAVAATPAAVVAAAAALPAQLTALSVATAQKQAADAAAARAAAEAAAAALTQAKADAAAAVARLQSTLARAQQTPQYQLGWAVSALSTVNGLLPAATTIDDFRAVTRQARQAISGLQRLFNAHDTAFADLAQAEQAYQTALSQGKNTYNIASELQNEKQQLAGAGTADAFNSIDNAIRATIAPLTVFDGVTIPLAGKVIVISLVHQTLSAVQDGRVILTTLVTTGRPQLPTPPGTTSVMSKSHPFLMVSSWPRSSPFYYPPSWVSYVLWFRAGGYGIHDAPWRSNYGPGTNGNNGTHGCVNVPGGVMPQLFTWADVGTPVIVH